jgi:hypothetical protein
MLKMVDGTGIIGVDMICPLGVSTPQPPNYDNIEMEGVGSLVLANSLKAPLERVELLGNSVQGENPSPDNPQEIKSAGRKSKNLFNIADLRVGQVQKDGTINEKQIYYRTVILDVPQDGKYRITFNSNDDYIMLYFTEAYANGAYSQPYLRVHAGSPNYYITLAKGKNILSFSTHTASGKIAFTTDHNIMIAAESETLDYEPYGYLLDVKVTGKNLLDMADIQNENGKIDSDFGKAKSIKPFKVIKDRKYLLISKGTMIVDVRYSSIYFGEDDLAYGQDSSRKLTTGTGYSCFIGTETRKILVAKETCTITKTMMHGTRTEKDAYEVEELGLFEIINDNPNTPYEPYTEQTVQIALDEPLRGIGEYKDVLTKDGVVRKIKRVVLDGSEGWLIDKIVDGNVTQTFVLILKDMLLISNHDKRIMCDKFKFGTALWANDIVAIGTYSNKLYLNVEKDKVPDLQTFKTWLSQNPLAVDYVLAEPVTEPLPESEQQQLQALHSENGTTHVFVVSGEVEAGIKLTYRKEK